MQFSFYFDENDYLAFQEHFISRSKVFQRTIAILKWFIPVVCVLVVICFALFTNKFRFSALIVISVLYAIISFIWVKKIPKLFVKKTLANIKKTIAKDKNNPIIIGDRTYMIDDNEIRLTTEVSETCVKWNSVTVVEETADYIYLNIATAQAFIVPKKKVDGTILQEIKAMIERKAK